MHSYFQGRRLTRAPMEELEGRNVRDDQRDS